MTTQQNSNVLAWRKYLVTLFWNQLDEDTKFTIGPNLEENIMAGTLHVSRDVFFKRCSSSFDKIGYGFINSLFRLSHMLKEQNHLICCHQNGSDFLNPEVQLNWIQNAAHFYNEHFKASPDPMVQLCADNWDFSDALAVTKTIN